MRAITILVVFLCVWFAASPSYALATSDRVDSTTRNQISGNADDDDNTLDLNITSNAGSVTLESTLQILILLTILSLAPSILIMLTSFTRIIVVFHFLRTAIGTQTTPPNQILIGLALFITFAVMSPVFNEVNTNAVQPYMAGNLTQKKALEKASEPLKTFMLKQTREKDLKLFMTINDISSDDIESFDDLSLITEHQIEPAMPGEQLQHMIQKAAPGVHLIPACAVEVQGQLDLCLVRVPLYGHFPHGSTLQNFIQRPQQGFHILRRADGDPQPVGDAGRVEMAHQHPLFLQLPIQLAAALFPVEAKRKLARLSSTVKPRASSCCFVQLRVSTMAAQVFSK